MKPPLMNHKAQYLTIIIITFFLSTSAFLNAKSPVTHAAATAIIDDQLQYEAYYRIKNSFFSITLDNQPLKTPGPKGLPIQTSFLNPGSRPTWIHVAPIPILKIYYNTPDSQTLIYEVELNHNNSKSKENVSKIDQEDKDTENIQTFPINVNLSQFSNSSNSKKQHPKTLNLVLQIATTHPDGDMQSLRYFIMLYGKH